MANKFDYVYVDPTSESSHSACGNTPYNIYDGDNQFCTESLQVCKWVAKRLGHPIMQLEFTSGSIYAMFEESVSEYSQHINNYNIRNWMWNQYGNDDTGSNLSQTGSGQVVRPNGGIAVTLSEQYGTLANIGSTANLHSASITLVDGQQEYDLQNAFSASMTEQGKSGSVNKRIEVQRVFHYQDAAISRFFDPFIGTFDQRMMLDQFGFASYAPSTTFTLRPIYYDVLRASAIETSDYIRRSNYSFEVNNNKVRLMPRPKSTDAGNKIWFQYYIKDEIKSTSREWDNNKVSDPSNVPHKFLTYHEINANGRQWIRKYTLALSKELLGIIRSKYSALPLPNGDVAMDGDSLKAEGREEKTQLLEELNTFLESVTLTEKARQEQEQADANQAVLNKSPLTIFLG